MNAVTIGNLKHNLSHTNKSGNYKNKNSNKAFFSLFSLLFWFQYKSFLDNKIILITITFFLAGKKQKSKTKDLLNLQITPGIKNSSKCK